MPYNVKQAAVQAVIEAWKNPEHSIQIKPLRSEGKESGYKLFKALNDLVIAWEEKE